MSFRPSHYPCPKPLPHPEHQHTEGPDTYMYICEGKGIAENVEAEVDLPAGWTDLTTYRPDAKCCVVGHMFRSEADCVLPMDWDYFLCRQCVLDLVAAP